MSPVGLIPHRPNTPGSEGDEDLTEDDEEQSAIDASWQLEKRANDKEDKKEDSKHEVKQFENNPARHPFATGRPEVVAHESIAGFNPNSVRYRLGCGGTHVCSLRSCLRCVLRPGR